MMKTAPLPESVASAERVAAFVVAYRRPALLRANLAAVTGQTRAPDAVIVINNDPSTDVRVQLADEFPSVDVVDLAENVGSAGGYAGALYITSRGEFTWAWLLDDDAIPEPQALKELLGAAERLRADGQGVGMLAPVQISSNGPFGGALWRNRIVAVPATRRNGDQPFEVDLAYWAGLLVHRKIVAQVGYPRSEFFRCFADYEYCLRVRLAGQKIVTVPTSRVAHHEGLYRTAVRLRRRSIRRGYTPARHYYDTRNAAFTVWHTLRSPLAVLFHIVRQCRLALGDLLYEEEKLRRVRLRIRGILDGLRGRLGRVEEIE